MSYRVTLSDDADADMDGHSPNTKRDVNEVLRRLRMGTYRRFDKQLEDTDGLWRAYARRRWRLVFEVQPGRRILFRRIRRRSDAYRGVEHPYRQELGEPEASDEAVSPPEPLPRLMNERM